MKAMVLKQISLVEKEPLEMTDFPVPNINSKEIIQRRSW